jgi:glycerol-3-phosphate acyltransferase PlsY
VEILAYVLFAVMAYLLGSIPSGYIAGLARGIDIRSVGSGNIGATNTFRILGKRAGSAVLLADALKGFLACWFAGWAGPTLLDYDPARALEVKEWFKITAGFAAILGHNYTLWLQFKGGKGIATTAGVLLALLPEVLAIALGAWIVMVLLTRYVSVASLAAAVSLAPAAWFTGCSHRLVIVSAFMGALAIYKHKANIHRLLAGTENRLQFRKAGAPKEAQP